MSLRAEVLLWAQRVMNRTDALPHQLLEIDANATPEQVQEAFHNLARTSHPDLHRTVLNAEELDMLTSAYSRVAGAYQDMRMQRRTPTTLSPATPARPTTGAMKPITQTGSMKPITQTGSMKPIMRPKSPTGCPPLSTTAETPVKASEQMNSKALVCYRKAELELRRGELKMALLQLKLAIAADPQSAFLRSALAEVQAELAKG